MAIVRSNSMDPMFQRGDVTMLEPISAEEIEEGDIIAVQVPQRFQEDYGYPSRVMHRVTEIERDDDGEINHFRTKGDAREEQDIFRTPPENVIGRHTGRTIPYLGLVPLFARSTVGMLVLAISFMLVVTGSYVPWHMTRKEEKSKVMSTIGGGLDALHNRLTGIENAVGEASKTVSDTASGLMVSRTADGKIGDIKQKSASQTNPNNIIMRRDSSDPKDMGVRLSSEDIEDKGEEEDMRTFDELDKEFQKGDISVDEFIDIRKEISEEEKRPSKETGRKTIDLRPLDELHKKYQGGEITTEEFIEIRKELESGRKDD